MNTNHPWSRQKTKPISNPAFCLDAEEFASAAGVEYDSERLYYNQDAGIGAAIRKENRFT